MAINITYPAPQNMAKVKKFGFYAPKTSDIDRVNGGRRTSTFSSAITISAGGTYTLDTFTWDTEIGGGIFTQFNDVYCLHGEMYLQILVDGNVVAEEPIPTSQSTVRVIADNNAVGSGSHTIEIRLENKGTNDDTLYVKSEGSLLEIIYGLVIKETTETTLKTISLPDYTLIDEGNGSFKYEVGVYVRADAIRRTTTNANMNLNNRYSMVVFSSDYSTKLAYGYIPSGNDESEIHIHIAIAYNKEVNITGVVGSSEDIIVITHLYYQITLMANQCTYHTSIWNLVSLAKGVNYIKGRVVAFPGLVTKFEVGTDDNNLENRVIVYSSSYTSEVIAYLNMPNMSQLYVYAGLSLLSELKGMILFLEVVVIE